MTNYTPNDAFATVQRYDTSDPVRGGATGESSLPIEQLADRTEWLNNRLGGYKDVISVNSGNITASDANKLIRVSAGLNVTLNLAASSTFKQGSKVAFAPILSGLGGPFWLNIVSASSIFDGSRAYSNIWMYDGEFIELVAESGFWLWTIAKGNFDKIGQDDLKRIQPRNTFIADGTPDELRSKYPRLWEVIESMAVPDGTWASNGFRYQSFFSTGNGTTTFRRPDMRAMSLRALDLGRGVSLGRQDETAGGYEADQILKHGHQLSTTNSAPSNNPDADPLRGSLIGSVNNRGGAGSGKSIIETGGSENRIKTIGFLPVIYY
jgi:hypothetical protein